MAVDAKVTPSPGVPTYDVCFFVKEDDAIGGPTTVFECKTRPSDFADFLKYVDHFVAVTERMPPADLFSRMRPAVREARADYMQRTLNTLLHHPRGTRIFPCRFFNFKLEKYAPSLSSSKKVASGSGMDAQLGIPAPLMQTGIAFQRPSCPATVADPQYLWSSSFGSNPRPPHNTDSCNPSSGSAAAAAASAALGDGPTAGAGTYASSSPVFVAAEGGAFGFGGGVRGGDERAQGAAVAGVQSGVQLGRGAGEVGGGEAGLLTSLTTCTSASGEFGIGLAKAGAAVGASGGEWEVKVPGRTAAAAAAASPCEMRGVARGDEDDAARRTLVEHILQPGDTLLRVAVLYRSSAAAIRRVNRLVVDDLSFYPHKVLLVPHGVAPDEDEAAKARLEVGREVDRIRMACTLLMDSARSVGAKVSLEEAKFYYDEANGDVRAARAALLESLHWEKQQSSAFPRSRLPRAFL